MEVNVVQHSLGVSMMPFIDPAARHKENRSSLSHRKWLIVHEHLIIHYVWSGIWNLNILLQFMSPVPHWYSLFLSHLYIHLSLRLCLIMRKYSLIHSGAVFSLLKYRSFNLLMSEYCHVTCQYRTWKAGGPDAASIQHDIIHCSDNTGRCVCVCILYCIDIYI